MSSETALLVITGVVALAMFAQHVLPTIAGYFGTEQDRWFSRSVQRSQRIDARHQKFFDHLAETTKMQAQMVATLQLISQTQNELQHQIGTIDRSLLKLAENQQAIGADILDIKDYTERVTDIALGLAHNERKNRTTDKN